MIAIEGQQLKEFHDILRGDIFHLASNSGKPHGGWRMGLVLKEIPLLLTTDNSKELFTQYNQYLNLNEMGQDRFHSQVYAEVALNILMQTDVSSRQISLAKFVKGITWEVKKPANRWTELGLTTIGQLLTASEFHKFAIDRMWVNWLTICIRCFDPPIDVLTWAYNQRYEMRTVATQQEALILLEATISYVKTNWLS